MESMTTCPHCRMRIVPAADGTCPACRRQLDVPAGSVPDQSNAQSALPGSDWSAFQQSLHHNAVLEGLQRLLESEGRFYKQQAVGVAWQQLEGQTPAEHAAKTVRGTILPLCEQTLQALEQAGQAAPQNSDHLELIRACVASRQQAWEAFERYLLQGDNSQGQLYEQLLVESNQMLQTVQRSLQQGRPAQQATSFQDALAAFTPHVWVTPTLVVINVAIFLAMIVGGGGLLTMPLGLVLEWGANFGPKTLAGEWWRLFTCMFLHFGLIHIGFNMWVLRDLGRLLERLVGNAGFIVLYVVSGIFASVASLAWNSGVVSAGASGAVFGACGALLGFLARRRDTIPARVLKPLRSSLFAFVGYNVFFGAMLPGIDMAAHIGGLVAGFFCGLVLSQPLSAEMAARRWRRNLVCLVAASAILPVAISLLPAAQPDVETVWLQVARIHEETLREYLQLDARAQRGALTDAAFADEIETKIRPRWKEAQTKLESLASAPQANQTFLNQWSRYMSLREQSWQQLVAGLREGDDQKIKEYRKLWAQANAESLRLLGGNRAPG